MFKKILVVLVVGIGGFLAYAASRPDTYRVERSTKIAAPPLVVFAQLEDFKAWPAWSPWEKRDPQMKKTFEGPPTGVGASYSWQGNKEVGKGKMSITASEPPKQIKFRLEFLEPFTAVAATGFAITPEGDNVSVVAWSMDGTNDLMGKIFGVFMKMEASIGSDFETGLAALKTVAEANFAARVQAIADEKIRAETLRKAAEAATVAAEAATAAKPTVKTSARK